MKIKKLAKKTTILLFIIFIIVGLFIMLFCCKNSKQDNVDLNEKSPTRNERQIVEKFFRAILKNSYNCFLYTGKINESLLQDKFNKKLIIKGLNYCKNSVSDLNKVNIPTVKSKENYLLLQKFKQNIIRSSECNVISNEHLLQSSNFSLDKKYEEYNLSKDECDSSDLIIFKILDKLSLIYDNS